MPPKQGPRKPSTPSQHKYNLRKTAARVRATGTDGNQVAADQAARDQAAADKATRDRDTAAARRLLAALKAAQRREAEDDRGQAEEARRQADEDRMREAANETIHTPSPPSPPLLPSSSSGSRSWTTYSGTTRGSQLSSNIPSPTSSWTTYSGSTRGSQLSSNVPSLPTHQAHQAPLEIHVQSETEDHPTCPLEFSSQPNTPPVHGLSPSFSDTSFTTSPSPASYTSGAPSPPSAPGRTPTSGSSSQ